MSEVIPVTRVDFFFDPVCPWCWITSRWLVDVAEHRDLEINWRTFSLRIKNRDVEMDETYVNGHERGLRALRVVEAARSEHGESAVLPLYTELGRRYHHDKDRDADLGDVLEAAGYERALASAADDDSWDAVIEASMKDALDLVGDDVGVPIISFDGNAGFFGPVLSPAPTGEAAAQLFDSLHAMATLDGFWELKRTRTNPPMFSDRP